MLLGVESLTSLPPLSASAVIISEENISYKKLAT
jgi:hypothetical protein